LPRWLWHFEELHRRSRGGEDIATDAADNREPDSRLIRRPPSPNGAAFGRSRIATQQAGIGFRPCSKPAAGFKFDHWSMIRKSGNRSSLGKREAFARRFCSKQGNEIMDPIQPEGIMIQSI
jgi:hypothetical protein